MCDAMLYGTTRREKMNAKYELEMLSLKSDEIDSLYEELERVRAIAEGMGSIGDSEHIQTSARADKLENAVIRIIEVEDKINDMIEQYLSDRAKIMDAIMHLEGPAIRRQTIYQKYVKRKTIKAIAKETHYDAGYIRHQCADGVKDIELSLSK